MNEYLPTVLFIAGFAQLGVLIASALVPMRLQWRDSLAGLPRLHRQLYWTYGGYVVLGILFNGFVAICNAPALAAGTLLSRSVCGYVAIFWGIRLSLQTVLDVDEHLTAWWLRAGYHLLTLLFASFTTIFAYAAIQW